MIGHVLGTTCGSTRTYLFAIYNAELGLYG